MFQFGKKVAVEAESILAAVTHKAETTVDSIFSEFDLQIERLKTLAADERVSIENREREIAALLESKLASFNHAARADALVAQLVVLKASQNPVVEAAPAAVPAQ